MPTKRRKRSGVVRRIDISDEAVRCWQDGNYWGLHRALGLRLWQMPSWCSDRPDEGEAQPLDGYHQPDVVAIKAALLELAGPPPERWWYKPEKDG